MVALVAMVGLVIDVGLQWGDNRAAQNGTDATAHAGALVIMRHLAANRDPSVTDAQVREAIDDMAATVEMDITDAQYTNHEGERTMGVEVGSAIGGAIPSEAQGVYIVGSRVHETVFAQVVGITELTVHTHASAVSGPIDDPCPEGQACALLPISVPNKQVTCDGQDEALSTTDPWPLGVEIIVPLCGNNPESVGWIDWEPPADDDSELAAEICTPNPPEVVLPDWFEVTATGDTNSGPVQTCLETWIDKVILIPLFDDACGINPTEGNPCPEDQEPSGPESWYHFPSYASLYLTGVYVNGSTCDTGTSCLTGSFVDTSQTGTVGQWDAPDPGNPPVTEFFAVQLVH